jgi:hypothetical protein
MTDISSTYTQFNNVVYETFFNNDRKGTLVILTIDEEFIWTFLAALQIDEITFLRHMAAYLSKDWSQVLYGGYTENPKFFGLIALQVYAAYLMDDDHQNENEYEYGDKAYNPRLCKLLNIDIPALQGLYYKYQDALWNNFSVWCNQSGFEINIPSSKNGPGRFAQYPLSQAILNKKDLRQLGKVFIHVGLRPGELFHFSDFVDLIRLADKQPLVTRHYIKVKDRLLSEGKSEIFYRQVFNYYNNWNGAMQATDDLENDTLPSYALTSGRYICIVQDNLELVEILNENSETVEVFSLSSPVALADLQKKYKIGSQGLIAFIENEKYSNEWIQQRYVYRNIPFLIITERKTTQNNLLNVLCNYSQIIPHPIYDIIQGFVPDEALLDERIDSLLFKETHVRLSNGLKLDNSTWMAGAGPCLHFQQEGTFWINGQKIFEGQSLDCRGFLPGRYSIKHRDYTPRVFFIKEPVLVDMHLFPNSGWQINKSLNRWEYGSVDYHIQGLYCKLGHEKVCNSNPVRNWILAQQGKATCSQPPIVIHALNRAANGIYH